MTEALRSKVVSVYNELKFIVEKDPKAPVGAPTIRTLRYLLTSVKDAGGDKGLADSLLESTSGPATLTISAADAFVIAGQLMKMTNQ